MAVKKKYYIGLTSSYHDSSICLVDELGNIVFAEALERYTQNKRSLSSPADNYFLIKKILKRYAISDYEIGYISNSVNSLFKHIFSSATIYAVQNYTKSLKWFALNIRKQDPNQYLSAVDFRFSPHVGLRTMIGTNLKYILNTQENLPYKKTNNFDHHLCHAYHAYFSASFNSSIIFIIDGFGDEFSSFSIYKAENQEIQLLFRNKSSASLGHFYGEITNLCGFDAISGEQWKVMGMAPYGKKNELLYTDFNEWFYTNGVNLHIKVSNYYLLLRENIKKKKYGNLSNYDLAFTAQLFYENITIQLLNACYTKWPHSNLIISGGCALNSAANGKIHLETQYKNVFIPSAPADDGCAIGAALLAFKKFNPSIPIPNSQTNPYLGFEINKEDLQNFSSYSRYKCQKMDYNTIYKEIAKEIANGKIIAWVQGRAEFGPRALGNRSILANPTLAEMKDKINAKVKFREEFRPFAPSIMEEYAADYFENYVATPYMERVLKIKKEKQHLIPSVTHIDGTGRLQTVSKDLNPHYYNLISEFYALTNIPIILNTSLNVMGKPIVDSVNDIAAVFATSGIDILVINDYVFSK